MPEQRTANEEWFDALIRHQIFLMSVSGSVRNEVIAILNRTERDVRAKIADQLARSTEGPTRANLLRARRLLDEIRDIRALAVGQVENLWVDRFRQLMDLEVVSTQKTLELVLPVLVETVLPAAGTLRALVREKPFEGKVLRGWAKRLAADDIDRISDQIQIGLTRGEPVRDIARRIVGSARLHGSDGVLQITRNFAATLTRTAVIHYSNAARSEFFLENQDIFTEERFVATLDARTTPICRSLDGKVFPIGEGPIPPLHYNCRSLRVAVIGAEAIGSRPFKATTERQLLEEFADRNGLRFAPKSRAALPHGTKGRFDTFARQRTRELIGQVPARVTYEQWLRAQSTAFQDEVLGRTRARLFRRGGLKLDRFVNRVGDEIPLSELARREAAAFRAAGLDPSAFR